MTEHVLIVGGGREIPGLIRAAREKVATTLMCRTDGLPKITDVEQHDRVLALRPDAPDAAWISLAAAVHADHPFTRIGTFGELYQDRAAALAAALGLPAHPPQTVVLVHDKYAMRQRLREAGVDGTAAVHVTDADQVRAFIAEHGGPCIVKPVRGAASIGVSIVREPEEADAAFARAAQDSDVIPRAGVLVEQFHEGDQYSVEAFSEDGEHEILVVVRKFSDPVSFVELGHVAPADLDQEQLETIRTYVRRLLDALQVGFGVTHTEIVLTKDGPRVIETHIRLAGDEIPYLVHDVTGVDQVDCVVRQTLGESVLPRVRENLADPDVDRRPEAIWFAVPPTRGTVIRIDGLAEAAAREHIVAVEAQVKPGDEIGGLASSYSRAAFVRARGDSAAEAVGRARETAAQLMFTVQAPGVGPAEWV